MTGLYGEVEPVAIAIDVDQALEGCVELECLATSDGGGDIAGGGGLVEADGVAAGLASITACGEEEFAAARGLEGEGGGAIALSTIGEEQWSVGAIKEFGDGDG